MAADFAQWHLERVLGERLFLEQTQLLGQLLDVFAVMLLELIYPELVLLIELLESSVLLCQCSHSLFFLA